MALEPAVEANAVVVGRDGELTDVAHGGDVAGEGQRRHPLCLPMRSMGRGTTEGGGGVAGHKLRGSSALCRIPAPATPPPCFAWSPSPSCDGEAIQRPLLAIKATSEPLGLGVTIR
jgi:hypothetical protein